ncbi:hypothetical protein FRC10_007163, partial [Ceratobasidium sp. 414]
HPLVDEIVIPTSPILMVSQIQSALAAIAVELYAHGKTITESILDGWLKSERGRQQSDILLIQPGSTPETFIWAPKNRPWGVHLPNKSQYCSCGGRWDNRPCNKPGIWYYNCNQANCRTRLVCEIHGDGYQAFKRFDTTYLQSDWPMKARTIKFNGVQVADRAQDWFQLEDVSQGRKVEPGSSAVAGMSDDIAV